MSIEVASLGELCQSLAVQRDLRAALQYVPAFRGKIFVLVVNSRRMPEQALAEALLDLAGLQRIGVKLVLISHGASEGEVTPLLVEGELRWQAMPPNAGPEEVGEIIERGQLALIEREGEGDFDEKIIHLAAELGAAKLILFLPREELGEAVDQHAISREAAMSWMGDAAAKLHLAASACEAGIPRVHLLGERMQGVLLDELFSNEGVGVMVHADDYLSIRPLTIPDIPELLAMIGRSMREAHLIPRTYEEVEQALKDFLVLTVDGNVVGCVALQEYEEGCAEVACLYVKQSHENGGYGRKLVEAAERKARHLGLPWIFALSNRAVNYFTQHLGYVTADLSELPASRQKRLRESGRQSSVIKKVFPEN